LIPSKKKDDRIAFVNYGRRYIIDSADVILEKYEKAKREGDNNVILDRLFNEYLTARYRRDPEFLRVMLLKASIEPYLHNNLDQVSKYFGNKEAQRKVLFQDWWNTIVLEDKDNSSEKLTNDFNKWFQDKTKDQEPTEPNEGGGE
jgi:hypothetical protein